MAESDPVQQNDPVPTVPVQPTPGSIQPVEDQQPTSDSVAADDRANARDRDIKSQKTDNKSWLYRNINPLLALMIVVIGFSFFCFVLSFDFTKDPSKKELVMYLVGGVQAIIISVTSYYFGSSKGSSDKSQYIQSINKN